MATIVNPDQVGKSIRNRQQAQLLDAQTVARVTPKIAKLSTAKIIAMLPRLHVDGRDHYARRTVKQAIARVATRELTDRGIELTEAMFGPKVVNRQTVTPHHVPGL